MRTLSLDGSGRPGAATVSDPRCVFCSGARFEQLTWHRGGAVITHCLLKLAPEDRREALRIMELHGGAEMRTKYAERVARQERRQDPARAKRKARGSYKLRRPAAARAAVAMGAWGVEEPRSKEPGAGKKKKERRSCRETSKKRRMSKGMIDEEATQLATPNASMEGPQTSHHDESDDEGDCSSKKS